MNGTNRTPEVVVERGWNRWSVGRWWRRRMGGGDGGGGGGGEGAVVAAAMQVEATKVAV